MAKRKRSFTMTDQADELLAAIARKLGVSKAAVLELAIREKATREGVELPK